MKLNDKIFDSPSQWREKGFHVPDYDRKAVAERTIAAPTWLHFGAGNIFRAFPAAVLQSRLESGLCDKGVIVAEGFDYEIIERAYRPFDNLSLLVTLKSDGSVEKTVVSSVVESLCAGGDNVQDWARLEAIFAAPSLQMVSFTITEKGYDFLGEGGTIAMVARLLLHRYSNGAAPLSLVSMDNCSKNGQVLQNAVRKAAGALVSNGEVAPEFLLYIDDPARVAFPWSMIDKITPRPDSSVQQMLREAGVADSDIIETGRRGYTAAFVNAEETQYLVIEDAFPNGRPPLEGDGVYFTDRDTVNKVETMKVCTCLNPLHTALAVFGCLLGYDKIHSEMRDPQLKALVERLGYCEGMLVVVNPGVLDPQEFIKKVLEVRFPNPFMPDTPQRIATDTSQKLAIRFGETVKAYQKNPSLDVDVLVAIPLVFAGWCRYLMAVDDNGNPFEPSPDPMLKTAAAHVASFELGDELDPHGALMPLLKDATIFGIDLYAAGLGERVEAYFAMLKSGIGAVRTTLEELLG